MCLVCANDLCNRQGMRPMKDDDESDGGGMCYMLTREGEARSTSLGWERARALVEHRLPLPCLSLCTLNCATALPLASNKPPL